MKTANPYLNFNGNTEEAFNFYRSVFGGELNDLLRYRDFGDSMGAAGDDLDRIAHVALPLGPDNILMGTDHLEAFGEPVSFGTNFHIALEADDGDEAERLFAALSEGGRVQMPLQPTEWAEKYGQCADRYGVQWMVMHTGNVQFTAQPSA